MILHQIFAKKSTIVLSLNDCPLELEFFWLSFNVNRYSSFLPNKRRGKENDTKLDNKYFTQNALKNTSKELSL